MTSIARLESFLDSVIILANTDNEDNFNISELAQDELMITCE